MMIHEITQQAGAHKKRKRVGRGESSGHGKTSTRGTKGSGARAGGAIKVGSEGGNMPFFRRLPKSGFNNNRFRQRFSIVNVADLEGHFEAGATVDASALIAKGLVRDERYPVKILGDGELTKKLNVVAGKFTKQAEVKIADAGGTTHTLELDRNKNRVDAKTGRFRSEKPLYSRYKPQGLPESPEKVLPSKRERPILPPVIGVLNGRDPNNYVSMENASEKRGERTEGKSSNGQKNSSTQQLPIKHAFMEECMELPNKSGSTKWYASWCQDDAYAQSTSPDEFPGLPLAQLKDIVKADASILRIRLNSARPGANPMFVDISVNSSNENPQARLSFQHTATVDDLWRVGLKLLRSVPVAQDVKATDHSGRPDIWFRVSAKRKEISSEMFSGYRDDAILTEILKQLGSGIDFIAFYLGRYAFFGGLGQSVSSGLLRLTYPLNASQKFQEMLLQTITTLATDRDLRNEHELRSALSSVNSLLEKAGVPQALDFQV